MEFFSDGAAADSWPTLQDERLKSGLGKIERGDQPVVSGTENHDVARLRHR
jgi:hypothetical protein